MAPRYPPRYRGSKTNAGIRQSVPTWRQHHFPALIAFPATEPASQVEHACMRRQAPAPKQADGRNQQVMSGAFDVQEIAEAKVFDLGINTVVASLLHDRH